MLHRRYRPLPPALGYSEPAADSATDSGPIARQFHDLERRRRLRVQLESPSGSYLAAPDRRDPIRRPTG